MNEAEESKADAKKGCMEYF